MYSASGQLTEGLKFTKYCPCRQGLYREWCWTATHKIKGSKAFGCFSRNGRTKETAGREWAYRRGLWGKQWAGSSEDGASHRILQPELPLPNGRHCFCFKLSELSLEPNTNNQHVQVDLSWYSRYFWQRAYLVSRRKKEEWPHGVGYCFVCMWESNPGA